MNYKIIFRNTGSVLKLLAVLLLLPAVVSLIYQEQSVSAFLMTAVFSAVLGFALTLLFKKDNQPFFAKEGLVIVAVAWLAVSLVGALPFVISGEIPSYIDAVFETASGFTTTGASILTDVESMSKGMLFWRSFTHWIGGMGVIVFIMAITSKSPDRSMHILRAEMPGPVVGKLVPKAKDTAKILYVIYLAMTALLIILLAFGDMDLFESVIHAFGTAGTGGFSSKALSIGAYSEYSQWVIAIFMLLFGVNFNLYYLIIIGKIGSAIKSRELWTYLITALASMIVIAISVKDMYLSISDVIRNSFFQTTSIMSTTGYSTVDFNAWPPIAKAVLIILMFVGGMAGSTAGGFKFSRVIILFKKMGNELKKAVHPRTASIVKFEGKRVSEETSNGVLSYFAIYMVSILAIFLLISLDSAILGEVAFETNLTASIACFNNIGPGFAIVGPMGSFASYSAFSKVILTIAMLLGRLEIYPLLLTLTPATWTKR